MTPDDLVIRGMTRAELDLLVEWAAREGWNPGLDDADVFWAADPEAFVAAELAGRLIGSGSIVSYEGRYGFIGFFIVEPDHRGRRLGDRLGHELKRRLLARLEAGAPIGIEGVFNMQDYYARAGFRFLVRDLRFRGAGVKSAPDEGVIDLRSLPFDVVEEYDRRHFPAPRARFLRLWIDRPGGFSVGVVDGRELRGYAVMRPCRAGFKIGPLFAAGPDVAESLFTALSARASGAEIFLDVPEANRDAMALVRRHGMEEVFGCARMVLGEAPSLPEHEIYGITTFELG